MIRMRSKQKSAARTIGVAVVALTTATSTASIANTESIDIAEDIDELANTVSEADPEKQPNLVAPTAENDTFTAKLADDQVVLMPASSANSLSLESPAASLEVAFPREADVSSGRVAADGAVVYQDRASDISFVAHALKEGAMQLQTVAHAPTATTFTYEFNDGVELFLQDDGSVEIGETTAGGSQVVYGHVEPPWATDAGGKSVKTHYEVEGATLIQHITPTTSTEFPVVADPKLSFGTRIYWSLNRNEQRYFGTMGPSAAAAMLCNATIGLACGAAAAAAVGIGMYLDDRGGLCPVSSPWLQIGIPYGFPINMVPPPNHACLASV